MNTTYFLPEAMRLADPGTDDSRAVTWTLAEYSATLTTLCLAYEGHDANEDAASYPQVKQWLDETMCCGLVAPFRVRQWVRAMSFLALQSKTREAIAAKQEKHGLAKDFALSCLWWPQAREYAELAAYRDDNGPRIERLTRLRDAYLAHGQDGNQRYQDVLQEVAA